MFLKPSEKGQGLVEYGLIAVIVIAVLAILFWLVVTFWNAFWAAGTAWIAGLIAGNPFSIFVAVVIGIILLLIIVFRIFPRR